MKRLLHILFFLTTVLSGLCLNNSPLEGGQGGVKGFIPSRNAEKNINRHHFISTTKQKSPPLLRGQVVHLDGSAVANTRVRLLEPDVTGLTDTDGLFKIRLPQQWQVGAIVTMLVDLEGHAVLRPWDGKLTIQRQPEGKLEKIIVAERRLVRLVQNDLPRVERIIQGERLAELQRRNQPEGFAEWQTLRAQADSLKISPTDLLALLNEWKTHAENSDKLSEQALAALYEKKYRQAIDLFDQDIANDESKIAAADSLRKTLPRKYLNKGIAHARLYEHDKAERAFKKAYTLDSTLVVAELWLISTLEFTGRLDEAMAFLQKKRRRYESKADSSASYTWTLNYIGIVYHTQGKLDSALVYYRQALAIFQKQLKNPQGEASVLGNIGIVYTTQGKLDSALVYYRQALTINQKLNRPEGMAYQNFNMGLLYEQLKDYATASIHFRAAFVYFNRLDSPNALHAVQGYQRMMAKLDPFFVGRVFLNSGETENALAAYRDSLAAHPDSLQGYIHIASVYSQTGPPDSVVANYRAVLARNPNHAEALNNLAWHFAMRNENLAEALALSQRSLALAPNEPNYLDTKAEILLRLDRFAEAQQANDAARKYAEDEDLLKSLNERGKKITAKLREQAGKR